MTAEFAKSEQQRLYAEMDTLCRARAAITNSESPVENSEEIIGRLSIDISEKAKDIVAYQLWFDDNEKSSTIQDPREWYAVSNEITNEQFADRVLQQRQAIGGLPDAINR